MSEPKPQYIILASLPFSLITIFIWVNFMSNIFILVPFISIFTISFISTIFQHLTEDIGKYKSVIKSEKYIVIMWLWLDRLSAIILILFAIIFLLYNFSIIPLLLGTLAIALSLSIDTPFRKNNFKKNNPFLYGILHSLWHISGDITLSFLVPGFRLYLGI